MPACRSSWPFSGSKILPAASIYMALMVKSRRRASSSQSGLCATLAWRPSVSISSRVCVISILVLSCTTVTVPCDKPVWITRRPVCSRALAKRSIGMFTAISISPTSIPASQSRTAPPTIRASAPALSATSKIRSTRGWLAYGGSDCRALIVSAGARHGCRKAGCPRNDSLISIIFKVA